MKKKRSGTKLRPKFKAKKSTKKVVSTKPKVVMSLEEQQLLQELNSIVVSGSKNLEYPPILDADPVYAANALTLEDEVKVLDLMESTYKSLCKRSQVNKVLERSIIYNKDNFEWFASFTLELGRLNGKEVIIPYEIEDKISKKGGLLFFPPLSYSKGKTVSVLPKGTSLDPIIQHRIMYIGNAYEATDFREGFPAWYMFANTTIYEKYSNRTGVRVRIDFENGEFHYYLAGASDNWKQIIGVPLEMDDVINTILFKD